jgi:hypothetical protein
MEEQYGMKQQHGGDDDSSTEQPQAEKKLKLDKYLNSSDYNSTDIFENLLRYYKSGKDVKPELEKVKHERMAILRAGIKATETGLPYMKMSKGMVGYYLIMIIFEMNWEMLFKSLVSETYNPKTKHPFHLILSMNMAYAKKTEIFEDYIEEMLVDINNEEALSLVAEMCNKNLSKKLKKHLMLISRDDIGKNRKNAIAALSQIADEDEGIAGFFESMLKRADEQTIIFILNALSTNKKIKNNALLEAVRELTKNKNPYIQKIAQIMVG